MEEANLYDHYKDSFQQTKSDIAKRDRFTIYLLIIVVFLGFHLAFQREMENAVDIAIKSKIKDLALSYNIVDIAVVIMYLWTLMQYLQSTLTVKISYRYLDTLETKLGITREGKHYKKYRTVFNIVCGKIYEHCFPMVFIAISVVKGISEWNTNNGIPLWLVLTLLVASIAVCICYIISMFTFSKS